MTRHDYDLAIVGSGFGGSLLSLIARKLGYSVALLERGTHPRFAIGESSTPLADFKLAAIADRFDVDWLKPFSKYGTWKSTYPQIDCGLKRGFSFFKHEANRLHVPTDSNSNALLVAASADNATSDTHWLRAEFDAHLVERAREAGVVYLDRLAIESVTHDERGWRTAGVRSEEAVTIRAGFVVDASGDGQLLAQTLDLKPVAAETLHARSRALYSHFTGVERWQDVLEEAHGDRATKQHTFPCDAAALHHILDGGWMWVLRFDRGVTSAGFSLDPEVHRVRPDESPEAEWARLLHVYPSLERQFARASPIRPFVRTGRLQRRLSQAAGADWALLPHAVGFLDAWLSPGIAQTLFAVERLGRILADDWNSPRRQHRLTEYSRVVLRELAWVDEITGTCFRCFDRFNVLAAVTMLYFAAAHFCEERERTGQAGPADAFLLADDAGYREIAEKVLRKAPGVPAAYADRFADEVRHSLVPYNLCDLCNPARRNMYPCLSTTAGACSI